MSTFGNSLGDRRALSSNTCHKRLPYGVLYTAEQETKEARVPNGYVFLCNNRTEGECLERKLFGAPKTEWNRVSQVKKGDILFLLNYQTNRLHGVFEAAIDGVMDIEPYAFDGYFPAQVRVRRKMRSPSLDEAALLPLIKRGWIEVSRRGVLLFPPRLGLSSSMSSGGSSYRSRRREQRQIWSATRRKTAI